MNTEINHVALAYLKVKIKSLAAESKIIRKAEIKAKQRGHYETNAGLYLHRVQIVRPEARSAILARAIITGRAYETVERTKMPVDYGRVAIIASKYGKKIITRDDVIAWKEASTKKKLTLVIEEHAV